MERSSSGSHATTVIMSSRRYKSSKLSPARCDLRKSWKIGPPSTEEKSSGSSTRLGSVMVCQSYPTHFLVSVRRIGLLA